MTDRYCSDCKHFSNYGDCMRNTYRFIDPVLGHHMDKGDLHARSERKPTTFWDYIARLWGVYRCGLEGAFWERKS